MTMVRNGSLRRARGGDRRARSAFAGSAALALATTLMLAGCASDEDAAAADREPDGGRVSDQSSSATNASAAAPAETRISVSGKGVGRYRFGTSADRVVDGLTRRLGEPTAAPAPKEFVRIKGHRGWYEVAGDPLSPSWRYRVFATTCWQSLCLDFGGKSADSLALRVWEVSRSRGSSDDTLRAELADTGIGLGNRWRSVHAAYPDTSVHGSEGASLEIRNTPWPTIHDGVGGWRLSGHWDYKHPDRVPPRASVIRLSGGQGPEPGCC